MAADRQLSRDFHLHEFRGWERASEAQVARLAETVARVLQPIRSVFGVPVRPTSWVEWSDGTPRTGAHAAGGTVDFTVDDGRTREAHEWAHRFLIPSGYIGRLIYEPSRTFPRQGEHVHMAPVADQVAAQGAERGSVIQVLEEGAEGEYSFARLGLGIGGLALAAGVFFCSLGARARSIFQGAATVAGAPRSERAYRPLSAGTGAA
jgi:hypothetical protein